LIIWHLSGPIAAVLKKFYCALVHVNVEDLAMHGGIKMDLSDSGKDEMAGSCEDSNEPTFSIKGSGFLNQLVGY